jgi:hypothetical protein
MAVNFKIMAKKIFLIVIILIIAGLACCFFKLKLPAGTGGNNPVFDPLNASYNIEGVSFDLKNGKAEQEIVPGLASKAEVAAWGQPALGDLNSDGQGDAALLLTYSAGGSGTFYYVAAYARDAQSGEVFGTNGILLGDRIAPQNIFISNGIITVNYADRKPDEPFSAQPSLGVTRTFAIEGNALKETTLQVAYCTAEQRSAQACIEIYDPVCAKVNIQCIKAPCDPVFETFSNSCFACINSLVEYYIKGECK